MRWFFWFPQEIAEDCRLSSDHVHICITTPGYRLIKPFCNKRSINFRFLDLDPAEIRATEAYKADPVRGEAYASECFSPEQAQQMAEFVRATEPDVVVNCEAGISRSPGVVLALRRVFGGDIEEVFRRARPCLYVTDLLEKALNVPS